MNLDAQQKMRSEQKAAGQVPGARDKIAFAPATSRDEQQRVRDAMVRKDRPKERDGGRERGRGEKEKRSRWDSAGGGKRERSRSPRR